MSKVVKNRLKAYYMGDFGLRVFARTAKMKLPLMIVLISEMGNSVSFRTFPQIDCKRSLAVNLEL